jgi:diacylglycerol kinase family enzyme
MLDGRKAIGVSRRKSRGAAKPLKVLVLLNAMAGGIEGGPVEAVGETVLAAFAKRGINAALEVLAADTLATHANEARQRAEKGEIDAVVAAGGDGTIRTVAAALADSGIALGVLPLGTLNHFAKDLGIPVDLQAAVDVIAAGRSKLVDAGEVNGRLFINNSSIGVYPYMVLERGRRRRRGGLQKWTAMMLAAFKMLRLFPLRRLRVQAAGSSHICRTPCLLVGNNEYRFDLFALGRRARLDAGELWLYIAKQQTRLSLIWFTFRALIGLTDAARDLEIFAVRTADIASRTHRLTVATDGEVEWMRPPLHYRIRPAALRVYAPIAADSAESDSR